jgi:hypothetical protein
MSHLAKWLEAPSWTTMVVMSRAWARMVPRYDSSLSLAGSALNVSSWRWREATISWIMWSSAAICSVATE